MDDEWESKEEEDKIIKVTQIEIGKLDPKPGDIIVIKGDRVTQRQVDVLTRYLKCPIFVFPSDTEFAIISKEDRQVASKSHEHIIHLSDDR